MDPSKHAPLRINDIRSKYKVIDKVGKGTYGTVYKVLNLQDNKYYAIKKFQNTDVKLQVEGFPITALREISLLKQLNHPNIVNLQEIICSKPNKRNLFRGSTFMVFEYMHHDFAGLFRSKIKFSLPQIKSIMKQLLLGCSFLHKNKVMHRDIKSANILLNDQGIVQLADFGLGRRTRFESVYTYKVVTLWYRAPELLLGCKTYNHKVDVWSIGCVFAELLTGQVLFKKQTQYAIIQKIYEICGDLQENEFTEDYLRGCVYYNDMRPKKSFKNTLSAFVKKINLNIDDLSIKFLQGLLELNPYKRLSCDQALQHQFFKAQPRACQPEEIQKLQVEYHEMFRDRSLKIDRKARKQSLNWSEEEELRKGKREQSLSQQKKTNRYPQKDNKSYPSRNDKQKSLDGKSNERKGYKKYESRYDDRKRDYVQKEYSSRNYEDSRYKKRYSKSPSRSPSSSSSSSISRRSRSRDNKRYYEDRSRNYPKRQERERKYYEDESRQKGRSYDVKQKIPEYSSKSFEQRSQSYKKDYYHQESKNRSYQSREKERRDYSRNQYGDRKQYSSRNDKYSRGQYDKSYQKSGDKSRFAEDGKSSSYKNDKYESSDYRPKDDYRSREDIKERTQDYKYEDKYEQGEFRSRKEDGKKTYREDYDRNSKPYSKQYKSEYPKKQYLPSNTQRYSNDRRPYEKSREKQYRDDKVSRQYEKESYDYSKKSSRYRENYRYKDDYRYQDQPKYRDNSRDDSKYRDESRYRNDDRNKEFLNKKVSIQSRQSTQKKKSSPTNKAMDVQQQY